MEKMIFAQSVINDILEYFSISTLLVRMCVLTDDGRRRCTSIIEYNINLFLKLVNGCEIRLENIQSVM